MQRGHRAGAGPRSTLCLHAYLLLCLCIFTHAPPNHHQPLLPQEGPGPGPLEGAARALDSAGGVRYWTDFCKAHLHPRSLCQLEGLWHGVTEWGGFGDGAGYAASAERREELAERIRWVGQAVWD